MPGSDGQSDERLVPLESGAPAATEPNAEDANVRVLSYAPLPPRPMTGKVLIALAVAAGVAVAAGGIWSRMRSARTAPLAGVRISPQLQWQPSTSNTGESNDDRAAEP